ncbi:antitoxin [Bacteroidia bacterium]|nr:antitoxin [Bacteroidia bacterium]
MPLLKSQKYLFDIQTSILSIYEYLGEKRDFFVFQKDKKLRRAIERELEIIGEATNRILQINPEFPVEDARKIVDLRNWVIHGYDKVDDVIIWGIVCNHLPKLKNKVDELLKDETK